MTWWQRQWQHKRYDAALEEDSGFGRPVSSRSIDMSYEEEVERLLKAAPLTVGAEAVESDGVKANCSGVFVEVLRDR